MITATQSVIDMINSPVRKITAKVEVYAASTLVETFAYDDKLMGFMIERVCEEGKFFGFGICQKMQVRLLDTNREVDYLTTDHSIKILFGVNGEYVSTFPTFHITQTRRDENTNELTIYGYDLIYDTAAIYTANLPLSAPYSILDFATVCASYMGCNGISVQRLADGETCFSKLYENGGNFEGSETIREALNDVAEATQTIYYLDANDTLVFKRPGKDAAVDLSITKNEYITLESNNSRRLGTICHTTELGDNISASITESGSTQYVRDNAFWTTLTGDVIAVLLEDAIAAVGGITINQFNCSWRGNFLLEICDKIGLTTKDDNTVESFVFDDTIEYNGAFQEVTKWSYQEDDTETATNSSSLGEVLKQTYSKVDKANKAVEIVVSDVQEQSVKISELELNTNQINATVSESLNNTNADINDLNTAVAELTKRVTNTVTSTEVDIKIQQSMQNGATSVTTETGFTFNEDGLNISKTGSDISTTLSEDGMTIYRNGEPVLVANNDGVDAIDLRASTYLIIGKYSRFEDYTKNGAARTGCFWIG